MFRTPNFLAGLGIFGLILYIAFFIAMIVGWFMNIFKLIGMVHETIGTEFVLRVIGIFAAPLGSIMGLFVS